MKKSFLFAAGLIAATTFVSCGSTSGTTTNTESASAAAAQKQVIGAEGIARPSWVVMGREAEDGLYAVGSGKMSTLQNSLTLAKANGRTELANTLQVSVKNALQTYTRDTGVKEDVLTYMEAASVQKSDAMLKGSKQVDYWLGPDETAYVLMFLPYQAVVPELNAVVKEYTQTEKTAFTVETAHDFIKANIN